MLQEKQMIRFTLGLSLIFFTVASLNSLEIAKVLLAKPPFSPTTKTLTTARNPSKAISFKCSYAKIAVRVVWKLPMKQPLDLKDLGKVVNSQKTRINVKSKDTKIPFLMKVEQTSQLSRILKLGIQKQSFRGVFKSRNSKNFGTFSEKNSGLEFTFSYYK